MFVMDCATPCKFLGNTEHASSPIEAEKTKDENTFTSENRTEEDQPKGTLESFCSLCNVEMSQTRTALRIEGWKGLQPKLADKEVLPIIVYLCPKCGKIDLKADEKLEKS